MHGGLFRHRQPKGPVSATPAYPSPRHSSTLLQSIVNRINAKPAANRIPHAERTHRPTRASPAFLYRGRTSFSYRKELVQLR